MVIPNMSTMLNIKLVISSETSIFHNHNAFSSLFLSFSDVSSILNLVLAPDMVFWERMKSFDGNDVT